MKIEIYATAQTIGQNDDRRAACALIMAGTSDDGRVVTRRIVFPLGSTSINLAHLQAVRLAAMSVRQWAKKLTVVVHSDSHYVASVLQKDGGQYKVDPKTNIEVVASLRDWCDRTTGFSLTYHRFDGGIGGECLALARDAAASQQMIDSGTKEFANAREAGI